MEIATLGEFGLIDRLTKDIEIKNESTKYGVGDDCAVLSYPDKEVLITTDLLMEGVHFDLTYIDLKHLGYKSAMVNISDVFAMNGTPRQITVSLALSKRFTVEDMEDFYAGLRLACDKWHVDIVGGDTTSSYTGLAISITCIGEARKEDIVYRNGARNTDLVCVSGDLGAAYMGLQLLEREKSVYYGQINDLQKRIAEAKAAGDEQKVATLNTQLSTFNFQPDFSGKEYLLQRQLQTEARGDIVEKLREAGIRPTAMMDISDGLSSEANHLALSSGVSIEIDEEKLPIDEDVLEMCDYFGLSPLKFALNGGEEYELLFTSNLTKKLYINNNCDENTPKSDEIHEIGLVNRGCGVYLNNKVGGRITLNAQAWSHL